MMLACNRFAVVPHFCYGCKRYIWLERYRKADVWEHDTYIRASICKSCLPKYLPDTNATHEESEVQDG